jgi:hypothetical protein
MGCETPGPRCLAHADEILAALAAAGRVVVPAAEIAKAIEAQAREDG